MKVAVIGGVSSTAVLVNKLSEHGFKDVSVWGYHPTDTSNVSGWVDLADVAGKHGYCYSAFVKVVECELGVKEYCPDALFVVGLSQIVPASILEIPRLGSVGFHPTALPVSAASSWATVRLGSALNSSAMAPATCGAASELPEYAPYRP